MKSNPEPFLARISSESLPLWLTLMVIIYGSLLLFEPLVVAPELLPTNLLLRSVSLAVTAGALYLLKVAPPPPRLAHALTCLLGLWVFIVATTDFLLLNDVLYDFAVQALLAATGMAVLHPRWAALGTGTFTVGWFSVRTLSGAPPTFVSVLIVLAALLISGHAWLLRRRILVEQWEHLVWEQEQRSRLQAALKEARKLQTQLDLEVELGSSDLTEALEGLLLSRDRRDELHQKLLHANRLEAVGRLAGGLAHRLNNHLTVVLGNLDLIETNSQREPALNELGDAARQGARLTTQLMPLSGRDRIHPKEFSVDRLLEKYGPLLRKMGSRLEVDNRAGGASVLVDDDAWYQIFSNLVRNADQANQGRGTVRLTVNQEGGQVVFWVDDEGPGIPSSVKDQIFEPYFTTRAQQRGTGLGLAIVLGLVEQMKGRIHCSNTSTGARFSVTFDALEPSTVEAAVATQNDSETSSLTGVVLVVEDDRSVRHVLERQLTSLGLEAHCAESGREALELFAKIPFDLVVTDVVMPGMDGPTLVKALRKQRPDLPVLFTSGYSDARLQASGLELGDLPCLTKPFDRARLEQVLRTLNLATE